MQLAKAVSVMIVSVLLVCISGIEEIGIVFGLFIHSLLPFGCLYIANVYCLYMIDMIIGPRVLPQLQAIIVIVFLTLVAILTVVYAPWMHQLSPWWFKIMTTTLYIGTLVWFYGEFYIAPHAGILPEGDWYSTNNQPVNFWTINHLLFGMLLGVLLPFWAMMIVAIGWETIEVFVYGDGKQGNINAIVDILIAVIGWWLVISLFSRKCVPWISARRSVEHRETKQYGHSIDEDHDHDDDFRTHGHHFSVYA